MLLKRLEISGFKSFAKATVLEFPTKITAIVGPNGSGKSNIADAIRWVLGEQSFKHLRGKRGEDLIFGGGGEDSPSSRKVARLSKATVLLAFDNKNKIFPVEFDEIMLSRRVYRDGVNDYVLNDSQVRLKDIVDLLSKVGLGASQHHIIAQGDSDRILYASPKERKSMVEEALGLKIFELKKNEAERKLAATEENIKQAESLRREIQPHLKYLASQEEKMRNAAKVREELEKLSGEYVYRELKTAEAEAKDIAKEKGPILDRIEESENDLKIEEKIASRSGGAEIFFAELKKLDLALDSISKKRRELEREIGRLESAPASKTDAGFGIPRERVKKLLMDLVSDLESVSRSGTMEAVRNTIFATTQKIYRFLESLNGVREKTDSSDLRLNHARDAISKLELEEAAMTSQKDSIQKAYESKALAQEKRGKSLRTKMEELATAKDALREYTAREERWEARKKEFEVDFAGWMKTNSQIDNAGTETLSESERVDLRKKIERLRIRLEEAGGVDEAVLKEYDETKKRDAFLAKELEDLKKTEKSLGSVFDDLEARISRDFEEGLAKINRLFGEFFREIFGGGKAEIKMIKPQKRLKEELDENWQEEIEEEPGLDIFVDIPRKRIKSLNMLSGGERALTSIALLFAMSTVNPPPFLVLDETDAALDEANSARYAAMLKDLGKKTQLVVVTHNRETMKAANVLYGVTMDGDGISKLLSIKFEEAENVLAKRT